MDSRKISLRNSADVIPCPRCGNATEFTIHSDRGGEDFCDVWAQCQCGHQSDPGYFFEDVWGGTHDANVAMAIQCWNDAMSDEAAQASTGKSVNG